ncbi:early nodulin-like protein 19 [Actinidia eriantha]|uniref:early nodulin-like protein 19 n=1 Tax=Actinidia eriantha TaxID=165200 RepID=UPI002587823E|nr:early nodulin-like protein 19 [Actinidia eriantha]XP_057486893.1 early nodulin-like protein 19 [Actinidia eriantha]
MERLRRGIATPVAVAVLACAVLVMIPQVLSVRYIVGSGMGGWNTNVNYTIWVQDKHFYNGDWLFFVYDRNQMNVLEVNKTDYENCISDHPLHNWTTGAGRDVVPLNVTRQYYFLSGKGFCFSGMKVAVQVENPPPPPAASPVKDGAPTLNLEGHIVIPAVFAIAAVWNSFFRFW